MQIKRSRWRIGGIAMTAGALFLFASNNRSYSGGVPDDWKAPARAAKTENPVPSDAASIAAGKKIYLGNCMACHGMSGKGDGPAAVTCNPRPKDLGAANITAQADGELFWKITEGKKPMPSYTKLLSETDRWKVINYVRTLAPPPTSGPSTAPAVK